jgi:hypothetical protein
MVVQLSRFEQGAGAPMEAGRSKTPIIGTEQTGNGEEIKRWEAG